MRGTYFFYKRKVFKILYKLYMLSQLVTHRGESFELLLNGYKVLAKQILAGFLWLTDKI